MSSKFSNTVELKHLMPTLFWPLKYEYTKIPVSRIKDPTTNLLFLKDSRLLVSFKFLVLTAAVAIYHSFLAALQILFETYKLFCNLTKLFTDDKKNRSMHKDNILKNVLNIIIAPLMVILLEITAIIGIILPLNCRKIYGSIERFMSLNFEVHKHYNLSMIQQHDFHIGNKAILAPCFQPKEHVDDEIGIEMIDISANRK